MPWDGTVLDLGVAALDRSNVVDATRTFGVAPTVGAEQALIKKQLWVRGGLDETTWTFGASGAVGPFKLDLALLRDLGAERTADVFGKSNFGGFATLSLDYERMVARNAAPR